MGTTLHYQFLEVGNDKDVLFINLDQDPGAHVYYLESTNFEQFRNPLAPEIFSVQGVTCLSIQPYRIWMRKASLLQWSMITPYVLEVLKYYVGADDIKEGLPREIVPPTPVAEATQC